MSVVRILLGCLSILAIIGCSSENNQSVADTVSLPVVRGSELNEFVKSSDLPVLVEFGVDYQCERCARMKSDIVQLGERLEGKAKVVRVDFTANAQLVADLGGTICPTYVLFRDGQPTQTKSFPISADLLEGLFD